MSCAAPAGEASPPQPPPQPRPAAAPRRFLKLRGVRWRIDLGILPATPSASIEELRRAAADSRRRYASLRRRLLVDPHLPKDESRSSNLVVDNPLSQNPDSTWGRFFRGAELEKTVDQDLSRLYPEDGSYFQTPACQAMLRRILLLWCLQHPEYGYRQGMHELLAPLVYVLQVDLDRLSQVRKHHEDCFTDDFDEIPFSESDMVFNYKFRKDRKWNSIADKWNDSYETITKFDTLDELDPDTKEVILLSDAYGAEGELGIVLSERFMEHDAYSMFDGLMDGAHGVVRMAEFFSPSNVGPSSSLPPVIEASSALYHLLSVVEPSLHSHFIELGVEPQYFALRWLRVLFGREFCLDDLLVVWDEVFACSNSMLLGDDTEYSFRILCSARGAFIAAMAVAMLLHLRSSLLATEIATSCLQRLLNFPKNVNMKKLIEKAKSLQAVAIDANTSSSYQISRNSWEYDRAHSIPTSSPPPKTHPHPLLDSYWEEKWRVLHKSGSIPKESEEAPGFGGKTKKSLSQKLGLSRMEFDPSPIDMVNAKKDARSSVRRNLLDSLSDDAERSGVCVKFQPDECPAVSIHKESPSVEVNAEKYSQDEQANEHIAERHSTCMAEETCLSRENSPVFSMASGDNNHENDHECNSERSSLTSNSSIGDNNREAILADESCSCSYDNETVQDPEAASSDKKPGPERSSETNAVSNERKPIVSKLQWLWKFGRPSNERNTEKSGNETSNGPHDGNKSCPPASDGCSNNCRGGIKVAAGDKKVMGTLKNLGQSMLENIQVIESVFQQDCGQADQVENLTSNILGGKRQVTAMSALKELRKISNLLCEM